MAVIPVLFLYSFYITVVPLSVGKRGAMAGNFGRN